MNEDIDDEFDDIYDENFCDQYFEVFTDSNIEKRIFITKQNYKDFYFSIIKNLSQECTDSSSLLEYTLSYLGINICEMMVDTINSLDTLNEINYKELADKWIENHISEITTVYSYCTQ